ncbi:hypothetical protein CRG98_001119 [Punica granatum]|uniref:Uncharacterized protein n=1 Tax=Punica granatum TaxID=22663 RepID=A0A2I0LCS3_PUNGR|nr:hypothetical protein CRG98_001119 [Punica granatum]
MVCLICRKPISPLGRLPIGLLETGFAAKEWLCFAGGRLCCWAFALCRRLALCNKTRAIGKERLGIPWHPELESVEVPIVYGIFNLADSILLSLEFARAKGSKDSTSEYTVFCLRRGVVFAAPLLSRKRKCIISLGNQWPGLSWCLLWKRPDLDTNDRERSNVTCWNGPLWRSQGELQLGRPQCMSLAKVVLA